jgi:hypothetical protein
VTVFCPVTRHELSRVQSGSRDPADGSGDAVVSEANAVAGELINERRANDLSPRSVYRVVTPVIAVEKKDIEGFMCVFLGRGLGEVFLSSLVG